MSSLRVCDVYSVPPPISVPVCPSLMHVIVGDFLCGWATSWASDAAVSPGTAVAGVLRAPVHAAQIASERSGLFFNFDLQALQSSHGFVIDHT